MTTHVDDFNYHILHRKSKHKRAQRDSGGLIIYISDTLRPKADDILLKSVEDNILWLKLKGSVFGLQNDVFICLCYNVPLGSSREIFPRTLYLM